MDHWFWYLATSDYSAAPQRKPDGTGQQATRAPIDSSFSSPFVGQRLSDLARWLANKTKSVDLDDRFFGVLDKQAENGTIALCRLGNREHEVEGTTCVLVEAEQSSLELSGMDSGLDSNEWVRNSPYKLDL